MKTPLVVRRTRGCLDLLRPRHPECPDEAEPPGDTCSQSTSSLSVSGIILQIFGGLVWILVACTLVVPENPQGWVMFVSVFCFVMTFIWMVVFACSGHHNKASWAAAVSIQSPQKYLKVGRMVRSGPSDHILITPVSSSVSFLFLTGLCVSRHRRLLLPQCLGVSGRSDVVDEEQHHLEELPAGYFCRGESMFVSSVKQLQYESFWFR